MKPELLESVLRRRVKSEIVEFLTIHPEYFDDAVDLALSNNQPYCWRAAWMIGDSIKKNDSRIKPHILKIIELLPSFEDGHQRELLKILLQINLEEDFESLFFDLCVDLWEQVRKQPSVRHIAFKGMIKVAEKYPELSNEILVLAQPNYINALSPGIKKSITKSISNIKTENLDL